MHSDYSHYLHLFCSPPHPYQLTLSSDIFFPKRKKKLRWVFLQCIPGWPGTHYIDQTGLRNHRGQAAVASQCWDYRCAPPWTALLKLLNYVYFYLNLCVCMCVCVGRHSEVVSLLSPYESQGLNSVHWVWQELPLPTELFHWPHCYILITIYLLFTSRICHSKLLLFLKLSYICVCAPVCKPHECYTRTWRPLYLESWVVMSRPIWLLGTEPTSFVRSTSPNTELFF